MSPRPRSQSRWCLAGAAATVLMLVVPDAAAARTSTAPTCLGQVATIVGTQDDVLVGTPGPDVIVARSQGEIHGLGGDDRLCGRNTTMFGGPGDDRMSSRGEKPGVGGLSLFGGPGSDTIFRDERYDGFADFHFPTYGGPGHDRLVGGVNLDALRGGPGRDRIFGRERWDHLSGGRGPDVLVGGRSGDRLRGQAGSDRLRGKGDTDRLSGGSGNDLARGGVGDDRIWAGAGSDVAFGGPDIDWCRDAEEAHCELP